MKIRGCYIIACILFASFSSCTHEQKEELVQTVSGYDREASLHSVQDLFVSFSCVQLQRTQGSTISNIEKVEMVDSIVIISADQRLLAFGKSGKYLFTYGGSHPKTRKYTTVTTFYTDPKNHVVVVDAKAGRLVTYTLDGQYQATRKVNPKLLVDVQDICQIDENQLFASKYIHNGSNTIFEVIDLRKELVEDMAHTSMKIGNNKVQIGRHPFSRYGDAIRWIRPFSKRIDGYNVEAPLLINSSKEEPHDEALQRIDDLSVAIYHPFMQDKMFVGFTDIFETKDYVVLACLDIESVVINKRSWKCLHCINPQRGGYEALPLLGIKASNSNYLVGTLFPLEFEQLKIEDITEDGLRKLLNLQQHIDKNGNPVLLLYEI